jgi:hypothetical protein
MMTPKTQIRKKATMGVPVSKGDADVGQTYAKIVFPLRRHKERASMNQEEELYSESRPGPEKMEKGG